MAYNTEIIGPKIVRTSPRAASEADAELGNTLMASPLTYAQQFCHQRPVLNGVVLLLLR